MAPGKRAFCVGNALVVGVVARIAEEVAARRSASAEALPRKRLRAM
jgi:hypothetical protein